MSPEEVEIQPPQLFPHADKVAHAGLFGIWSFFLVRASLQRWSSIKFGLIGIAIVLVGILTEVLQGLTTYRTSDPWDVMADIGGAVIILLCFKYWFLKKK